MTDIITMERQDLDQYIKITAEKAIAETLNELGIKRRPHKPWVSQNYAVKTMGISIKKLRRAVERGLVKERVDVKKITHNRLVFRPDVQRIINNASV